MQSVKRFLLPIQSRQRRFDHSKPMKSFLNQSQTKQTDQTNLWYELDIDITCQSNP
jgi:hypothetical protein